MFELTLLEGEKVIVVFGLEQVVQSLRKFALVIPNPREYGRE